MHANKRLKFAAFESKNLKRQPQLFVIFKRNWTAQLSIIHASIISTSVETADVDVRRCLGQWQRRSLGFHSGRRRGAPWLCQAVGIWGSSKEILWNVTLNNLSILVHFSWHSVQWIGRNMGISLPGVTPIFIGFMQIQWMIQKTRGVNPPKFPVASPLAASEDVRRLGQRIYDVACTLLSTYRRQKTRSRISECLLLDSDSVTFYNRH